MRRAAVASAMMLAFGVAAAGCGGGGAASPASTIDTSTPIGAGKAVFLGISGCGACHTLADAGSSGKVASNLDEKKPSAARVQEFVEHGNKTMPSYGKQLTAQQIADVAAYVAWAAGR